MSAKLTLQISEENGRVWAEILELPGCFAEGRDLDELVEAVGEAVSLYAADNPEAQAILQSLSVPDDDVVVDFSSHRERRAAQPRVVVKDIHADVEFDELVEA